MYQEAPSGYRHAPSAMARYAAFEAAEAALVRAIVRGEKPVATLRKTSIYIWDRHVTRTFGRPETAFQSVTIADLAEGLLALKDRPAVLTDWAGFVVMTSEFYNPDERHGECGERLFQAIWDLSFGKSLDAGAVRLAQSIRDRFSK